MVIRCYNVTKVTSKIGSYLKNAKNSLEGSILVKILTIMFGQFIQALHKFGVMVLKLNINKTAENF